MENDDATRPENRPSGPPQIEPNVGSMAIGELTPEQQARVDRMLGQSDWDCEIRAAVRSVFSRFTGEASSPPAESGSAKREDALQYTLRRGHVLRVMLSELKRL